MPSGARCACHRRAPSAGPPPCLGEGDDCAVNRRGKLREAPSSTQGPSGTPRFHPTASLHRRGAGGFSLPERRDSARRPGEARVLSEGVSAVLPGENTSVVRGSSCVIGGRGHSLTRGEHQCGPRA
ncbi:Hypp5036 [Branchiostoma lanceolatum]|uniref:Hypp5036 protein n=1 Tax=Branchiostoma lanceolatum TaxID=7740 RepID=A0A8K0F044_BRALA|nr:Hypp5036 [Branchiostoma lanceolatum]